jgi:hypothetical protein
MRRRTYNLALAAVIGLIALSLLSGAAAADSGGSTGAPKSLTHHFPLGTQTLSPTKTAGGSTTSPHRATPTAPRGGSAATPRKHGADGVGSVLFLLAIPVVIAVALLSRAAIHNSRRKARRSSRRPIGWTRSAAGARWAYVDKDEVERTAPPLPVRQRDT